ncbi:acyl carrier protein [Actinoalloteichus caeruleus]|uniref:acyl carrier protein n=1 Tax=Actinoalloteichus cyanogriseus TaxID=2893586 RepID=UPI000415D325|nr:acyl carrier protein [Actinoalloteichus caeruleus]
MGQRRGYLSVLIGLSAASVLVAPTAYAEAVNGSTASESPTGTSTHGELAEEERALGLGTLRDQIHGLVADQLGISSVSVEDEHHLVDDLGATEEDTASIVDGAEATYGVQLLQLDVRELSDVGSLVLLVRDKLVSVLNGDALSTDGGATSEVASRPAR